MVGSGEEQREAIRPELNRSFMKDFQGAKIMSDYVHVFPSGPYLNFESPSAR